MQPNLLFLILISLGALTSVAQHSPCGTDEMVRKSLEKYPELEQNRIDLEKFTEYYTRYGSSEPDSGALYIIPTVFHIIHNYGIENISKDQVLDALKTVNEDFQNMNADTADVVPAFKPIIGNAKIEFRLAQIDPDGNCTDGITRTVSDRTFFAGENVKDLISWNTNQYLNIWVVDNISFGAAAYAYYPGTAPSQSNEGIVNRHDYLGGIGTSNESRTLSHEIGHYLNLPHVWGNSNNVALPTSCSTDDGVSDTPNSIGSPQSCDLSRTTCGSLDNVQNHMDYSVCRRMFTKGQALRMHAALNSINGGRSNLSQQSNLVATGTNDGFVNSCAPIADFSTHEIRTCNGFEVEFMDLSYNGDPDSNWTWNWQFPGGTPSQSSDRHPKIVYATPGKHSISLTVSNSAGSDTKTVAHIVNVGHTSGGYVAPFYEGMELTTFPYHDVDTIKDWVFEDESEMLEWTTDASHTGYGSLRFNILDAFDGQKASLISPPIDLSSILPSITDLTFEVAYAKRNNLSDDILKVYVSADCGASWELRFVGTANQLRSSANQFDQYVPNSENWKTHEAYIEDFAGKTIMLKFEVTVGNGNNLYLDNINIGGVDVSIEKEVELATLDWVIAPNPSNEEATIIFNSNTINGLLEIQLLDVLGREIGYKQLITSAKTYRLSTDLLHSSPLPKGSYFIRLSLNGKSSGKHWVKTSY